MNPRLSLGQDEAGSPRPTASHPNPYGSGMVRPKRQIDAAPTVPELQDAEGHGLDGDLLDSILTTRYIEGKRRGQEIGDDQLEDAAPKIYDEGFEAGERTGHYRGRQEQRQELVDETVPLLADVEGLLVIVLSKTRGDWSKERLELALAKVKGGKTALIGGVMEGAPQEDPGIRGGGNVKAGNVKAQPDSRIVSGTHPIL